MNKAVLISIKPEWIDWIANGEKTLEVRKTRPKIKVPFKCYIYATKDEINKLWVLDEKGRSEDLISIAVFNAKDVGGATQGNGKVIGEFICDHIIGLQAGDGIQVFYAPKETGLSEEEILKYAKGKMIYYWNISDLKIYDKPRELYEFYKKCEAKACEGCEHLKYQGVNRAEYDYDCEFLGGKIPIKRPPQSWCYVEGLI